jgi:hypothetical protein
MWYFRKLGWFVGIAFGTGTVIAYWYRPWIESHSFSPLGHTLLQLAIPVVCGLLFIEINVRLIYWFGIDELNHRVLTQWTERITAHVEDRPCKVKWSDFIDFVASWDIWGTKIAYSLHLWNWPDEE